MIAHGVWACGGRYHLLHIVGEGRTLMSVNATTAAESGRPRRRLVGQLWFWVLVAITART